MLSNAMTAVLFLELLCAELYPSFSATVATVCSYMVLTIRYAFHVQ